MAEKKRQNIRVTNVELHERKTSVMNNDNKIYSRGYDNLFPLRIEKVINNSSTGRRCANLMAKYILGKGVANGGDEIVNKKGETLQDIAEQSALDIAYQYGVFYHLEYKADVENVGFKIGSISVLDYTKMAKSKEDDKGFAGRYFLLDLETKTNIFSNTNKKTGIKDPTIKEMIQHYRGQVYYLNLTPKYIYSLPLSDSVYNDLDTEYRIATYGNTQSHKGWLGKTIITKFADDNSDDDKKFEEEIKKNLGAENSASVLTVTVPTSAGVEDLNKALVVKQLKAQYDDKLFDKTIQNIRQNIMGAFNNIPEALVFSGNGSLFGTNSETYKEMKQFYYEQNETERNKLEQVLSKLLSRDVQFESF